MVVGVKMLAMGPLRASPPTASSLVSCCLTTYSAGIWAVFLARFLGGDCNGTIDYCFIAAAVDGCLSSDCERSCGASDGPPVTEF